MYEIKKDGAWHLVYLKSSGVAQFRSLKRANCLDWIEWAEGRGNDRR